MTMHMLPAYYTTTNTKRRKKKAQKRWEKLRDTGSLRTELEIHGTGMDIDVIR